MKAGRSYDCGGVSVTTARSARSKNCYKKGRKWDRVNLRTFALIVSAHPYCARKSTCHAMPRHASSARAKY